MKKLLLNASTLNKGGGVQAATTFIRSALSDRSIEWFFAVSKEVDEEVRRFEIPLETYNKNSLRFDQTPARFSASREALLKFEKQIEPEAVFSFFGPAYVRFRAPHLLGVAHPWVTHAGFAAYKTFHSPLRMFIELGGNIYRGLWFKKAEKWVVEANVAKRGLIKRLGIHAEDIFVVPNSFGQQFIDYEKTPRDSTNKKRILVATAYYPHKNLEIIPAIAEHLVKRENFTDFEFVITLDEKNQRVRAIMDDARKRGVSEHINMVGYKPSKELPELYHSCDIAFLPSLLEAFSANYPEAMITGTPLVTTDFEFSRDACGNAAEYFKHSSPQAGAKSLLKVIQNQEYARRLVENGYEIVKSLPDPAQKYRLYLKAIDTLLTTYSPANSAKANTP